MFLFNYIFFQQILQCFQHIYFVPEKSLLSYNFIMEVLTMVHGLGERLQQKRSGLKISQKEAAAAIGVSYSIISNYEKNERTPSLEKLMALANLYRCSVDYLLGIEKSSHASIDVSMLDDEQRSRLQYFLPSINK